MAYSCESGAIDIAGFNTANVATRGSRMKAAVGPPIDSTKSVCGP